MNQTMNLKSSSLTFLRVLSGLLFLATALFHFDNYITMAAFVPLPWGSKYFVLLIAIAITICSILLFLGKFTRQSYFALAIIFGLTGLMILVPTVYLSGDPFLKNIQLPNLYKIIIAFLMFMGLIIFSKKK
jgi:uncharacterized membrane protein YphA (DoxX/SURF4 family)